MSVSGCRLESEVVAWSQRKGGLRLGRVRSYSQQVSSCTVQKEHGTDRYVHSVESGGNEEDGSVDVIAEGEQDSVLVLVSLAEQEDRPQKNC